MRQRRAATVVAAVIVGLIIAVVALAWLNRSDAGVQEGSVAITRDGKTLTTFTLAEVRELRSVSAKKKIVSSNNGDEEGTFTGVPLRTLLDEVSPTLLDKASMVVTRATDGYVSSLDAAEVGEDDDVLLVYEKDGESLGTSEDGGTGPFRIVILSDTYGNRCTKWVNEIEVR